MGKLKPCPCGKTPTDLIPGHNYPIKETWVSGNCCFVWNVPFTSYYAEPDSGEYLEKAMEAWNGAPRRQKTTN